MRTISFDFGLDIRKPPYSSLRAFYCTPHYRVIPVYLSDKDADTVLKRLQEKKQKGELFTEEDFAQLAIAPLMNNSNKERKDVILESLKLSKTEKISQQKKQWQCFTHWQINF